jgi:4-hydroxy-2-oxovalerate aldolase
MKQSKSVTILDCTLRDGSYVVRQQFTAADTGRICAALEAGGVREIEIGHGFGLGASGHRLGIAAASDEEYVAAAARSLRRARFGMFYIPGIGTTAHLDMAREHGMHFVRMGTNVHQHQDARRHIEHARRIGLQVSYNAMKSYLASPEALRDAMCNTVAWGAQAVYVVDSAGTLIPNEVKAYVRALADSVGTPIGFHGHNNLMLANANCLAAWEEGATLFDGTLQGIGRSGGNAQSEILALVFERMKVDTGIDVRQLLDAGERLVRPLMGAEGGGATSLNVVIGMAAFHSSYLDRVNAAAQRFGVDLQDLILAVCELDRVDPSAALIQQAALELARHAAKRPQASTAG